MKTVTFTYSNQTLYSDISLVYKESYNVVVTGSFAANGVFVLTVKKLHKYNSTPLARVVLTRTSATQLTGTFTLDATSVRQALGSEIEILTMADLEDTYNDTILGVTHSLQVMNCVQRDDDTTPDDPDENTYTDDEIIAMFLNRVLLVESDTEPANPVVGTLWMPAGQIFTSDGWVALGGEGGGDISGTTGSTDHALIRASGTGGKTIQGATVKLSDDGMFDIPVIATEVTAPTAGFVRLYMKSDGLYIMDENGNSTRLTF